MKFEILAGCNRDFPRKIHQWERKSQFQAGKISNFRISKSLSSIFPYAEEQLNETNGHQTVKDQRK